LHTYANLTLGTDYEVDTFQQYARRKAELVSKHLFRSTRNTVFLRESKEAIRNKIREQEHFIEIHD
jgi:hypothetical protein